MAELPRLNGVIRALSEGRPAFTCFSTADVESAVALATSKYDGVTFEMEHNAYDIKDLRDCLQYMLNRRQIVEQGTLPPAVSTTIVFLSRPMLQRVDPIEIRRE